jgi:lipid A 3-O-deacylase
MGVLRPAGLALLAALSPALAAPAAEAVAPPAAPVTLQDLFRTGDITVYLENDKFFAGTDRHYTNGFKLSFLGDTKLNESPGFVQAIASYIPTLTPDAALEQHYKVGVALGQNIYTPTDTESPTPAPTDRPYAAWLYGALTFQAENRAHTLLRTVELSVGIVGPSALGEQVQNGWHSVIKVPHAQGWSHQLHNEPGIVLAWEHRYRVKRLTWPATQFGAELFARGGLAVGNVDTSARLGLTARIGWKLPPDFGPDLIRAAGGDVAPIHRSSFYLYGGAAGRAVARDIFLDGNTWRDSPSADKRPLVADFTAGLVARFPCHVGSLKGLQVAYCENYRTKEFYGQLQRDVFGSINLSFLF